jgi:hypothetical protein
MHKQKAYVCTPDPFFQREVQSIKAFVSHPTQNCHPLLLATILLAFIPFDIHFAQY